MFSFIRRKTLEFFLWCHCNWKYINFISADLDRAEKLQAVPFLYHKGNVLHIKTDSREKQILWEAYFVAPFKCLRPALIGKNV